MLTDRRTARQTRIQQSPALRGGRGTNKLHGVYKQKKIDKKKIDSDIDLKIENVNITRVYECKFLGVIVDSKLNWKSHILMVKEKLIKCNAIMLKASVFLDSPTMRTLHCSLFLPHINYCSEVWGITYKKQLIQ